MASTDMLVQEGHVAIALSVADANGSFGAFDSVWDTFDGGSVRASSRTYRPGGGAPEELTVGFPTVEEITLSRGYRVGRDTRAEATLLSSIGHMCQVTKYVQYPYSVQEVPETRRTYTGRIVGVTTPKGRSDGGEDIATLSVTIGVQGLPK